jgi:hypothetical protein
MRLHTAAMGSLTMANSAIVVLTLCQRYRLNVTFSCEWVKNFTKHLFTFFTESDKIIDDFE